MTPLTDHLLNNQQVEHISIKTKTNMNGLVHDHKAPFIIGLAGKNYFQKETLRQPMIRRNSVWQDHRGLDTHGTAGPDAGD